MYDAYSNTFYMNDGIAGILVGLLAAVVISALMVRVSLFAVRAASLYRIARRRGLRGAWLAWVPVCCDWILGSVADQYQYVVKGRIKNRRLPLLLLGVAVVALKSVVSVASVELLVSYVRMMMGDIRYGAFSPSILAYVLTVVLWACSVAHTVIRCIAVYDLYSSCTKKYNVLYLVLGLVFRFMEPVFFFICRNREEGMPPRRETVVVSEPEPQTEV